MCSSLHFTIQNMAEGRKSSRLKRWSLKGMTALVTGGTRGIGHETVEELAEFGATIHTCSRNQNELDECLEEWKRKGYQVTGSVCDLSCRDQREKLIETVSSLFQGKLNILVNNAAKFLTKRTTEVTSEDFSMIMATNFESCYHLCQLGHPLLKASENGSIVFISSVAGGISLPYVSVYTASKGAMNQLTKTLACEWAKDNIRSNAVAPWITKTSLVESVLRESAQMKEGESALMKEGLQPFIDRTPIGRIAEVEDVSSLIAFLCLPAASYITGQVIYVDGGYIVNGYP